MTRLNDLNKETRLDLIEESRLQCSPDYVNRCIDNNANISTMCDWELTRQGSDYWLWVYNGRPS